MSVGNPLNKQVLDSRIAYLTVQTRDLLDDWTKFKSQTDSLQDSDLTGMGYTTDDITAIRGLAAGFAKLRNIANGQDTQSPASNFFFFAAKVIAFD